MNNLLQINIEATFILILIYFIYRALLSKDTNFVFNRFFLIGGTFISYFITIPFFKFFTNSDQIFEGQLLSPVVINAKNYQNQIIETISSESNITIIYLVITGLFALHFTYKLIILAYFFLQVKRKDIQHILLQT